MNNLDKKLPRLELFVQGGGVLIIMHLISPILLLFYFCKRGFRRRRIGYLRRNKLQSFGAGTLGATGLMQQEILDIEEDYLCRA